MQDWIGWGMLNGAFQAGTGLINQYLNRRQQRKQFDMTFALEAKRLEANIEAQKRELQHEVEMFERVRQKEISLRKLEFEYQILVANHSAELTLKHLDKQWEYDKFPLKNIAPSSVAKSPQDLVIISRNEFIKSLDNDEGAFSLRQREFEAKLNEFLRTGWRHGGTILYDGPYWKDPRDHYGIAAVNSLYICLRDRPTLFMEYQLLSEEIIFNVAFWGPASENLIFDQFAKLPLADSTPEQIRQRLLLLRALAAGGITDIHMLSRDLSTPVLPGKLGEMVAGNEDDEVILKATAKTLNSYVYALSKLGEQTPRAAKYISLEIFNHLNQIPDKRYVEIYKGMERERELGLIRRREAAQINATSDKSRDGEQSPPSKGREEPVHLQDIESLVKKWKGIE